MRNRVHRKSWYELQATVKVPPATLLAAVKITLAMSQGALEAKRASVKKRSSSAYALVDRFHDLSPPVKIQGVGTVGAGSKQQ